MKVFVIGSMTRLDEIKKVANMRSKAGNDVEYVKSEPEKTFSTLVDKAFDHISKADKVVAVTKCDGSLGEGTIYELAFAKFLGKNIVVWDGKNYDSYKYPQNKEGD